MNDYELKFKQFVKTYFSNSLKMSQFSASHIEIELAKDAVAFVQYLERLWSGRKHVLHVRQYGLVCHEFTLYGETLFLRVHFDGRWFGLDLMVCEPRDGNVYETEVRFTKLLHWFGKKSVLPSEFVSDLVFLGEREFSVENKMTDDELYVMLCKMGLKL